jgi:hypothetical protein
MSRAQRLARGLARSECSARGHRPQRGGEAAAWTLIEPSSTVGRSASLHWVSRSALSRHLDRWLAAGCGWPVRMLAGCLVWAPTVVAGATHCGVRCLSFVEHRVVRRIGGTGDVPVESLFPQGCGGIELAAFSGWPRVVGIDAVGGSPHCDFADERDARVAFPRCPCWLCATLAGVVLDLVGELGDHLGSLCQVASPDRIGMERWWNGREPGQRTWIGRRERCEAPVQHGRHIVCGSKVASAGGCQQMAEWMLSRFSRQGEQVGAQGWPSRLGGEPGKVVFGVVELCDGVGSEELFGCDVEAVGVALDRLAKPRRWVVELPQQGAGGERRFIAGEDVLQRLGRRAR